MGLPLEPVVQVWYNLIIKRRKEMNQLGQANSGGHATYCHRESDNRYCQFHGSTEEVKCRNGWGRPPRPCPPLLYHAEKETTMVMKIIMWVTLAMSVVALGLNIATLVTMRKGGR